MPVFFCPPLWGLMRLYFKGASNTLMSFLCPEVWVVTNDGITMKTSLLFCAAFLGVLIVTPAHADIFKCLDTDGHITYSNVMSKNCKKLNLEPASSAPTPKAAPKSPTPANFPKVDDSAQKARDNDRRRILESELATEQKNLDQAKKDLAEQEGTVLSSERMQGGAISGGKVLERVQPFKDKAALHERNIEAIQKEISKLR